MAHITSRRGTHDNVVTYEFICDTTADMTNIEQQYITLGSVCVVINGNIGNLEVYIANSNKEWVSIGQINGDPSTIEELREMVDAIVESSAAAVEAISSAEEIVEDAQEYAEISEAWAIGKKNGVAVGSSEPQYQNNAKYWSDHAFSATPQGYEDLVDGVDDLKSAINNGYYIYDDYVSGARGSNGSVSTDNKRCTTASGYQLRAGDIIAIANIDAGYKAVIAGINNGSFVFDSDWKLADYSYVVLEDGFYFVNIAASDGTSVINASDIQTLRVIIRPALMAASSAVNQNLISYIQEKTPETFGVAFTQKAPGLIHVQGTASIREVDCRYFFYNNRLPGWLVKGKRYYVNHFGYMVKLHVMYYAGSWQYVFDGYGSGSFVIPSNATGINIALHVAKGVSPNEDVRTIITEAPFNTDLYTEIKQLNGIVHNGTIRYDDYVQGGRDSSGKINYYIDRVTTRMMFSLVPGDKIGVSGITSGQNFAVVGTFGYTTGWLSADKMVTVATAGQYYVVFKPTSGSLPFGNVSAVTVVYRHADLPNANATRITAIENAKNGDELLYIPVFRQGANDNYGYVESNYRITSDDTVGLPMGTERVIKGEIYEDYVLGIRTGVTAQNLNHALYWYTGVFSITIPDGDNYYRIYIARNTGDGTHAEDAITPKTPEEMGLKLWWTKTSNVLEENREAEKILSAARLHIVNPNSHSTPNNLTDFPVILHTSDPHGDYQRVKNFFDFAGKVHADAACVTGDMCAYENWNNLGWFKSLVNASNALPAVCVGNHDVQNSNTYPTDEDTYNLVFGGIETKIGSETGKTWYSKDITDKKLRIISVNLYQDGGQEEEGGYRFHTHLLSDQMTWLISTLSSTPEGYGILLLTHAPQRPGKYIVHTSYDTFFQTVHEEGGGTHNDIDGAPIYDLIDAFIGRTAINRTYTQKGNPNSITVSADFSGIDSSVEFIAHLTGHYHNDHIGYVQDTTQKQLMLCVITTAALYGGTSNPYITDTCDMTRNKDDATQDAFNAYVIDRSSKKVTVVRIGADRTYDLTERKYMTIPYAD